MTKRKFKNVNWISDIIFLGTSSSKPCQLKFCSSMLLKTQNGNGMLFDCGESTQLQLMKAKFEFTNLSHIFITHLHGDHFFGIFGLLNSLSAFHAVSGKNGKRISIIGPLGIKSTIKTVLSMANNSTQSSGLLPNLDLEFFELSGEKSVVFNKSLVDGFSVSAHPLVHRVPAYGYIVEECKIRGKIDFEKTKQLNIPDTILKKFERWKAITLEDGRVILPKMILTEPQAGKKISFIQDTFNSDSALEAAFGSDILIHECTFSANMLEEADKWKHSTSAMAGAFAKAISAKKLFLTHFSGRFGKQLNELRKEAAEQCPETEVFLAKDLMQLKRCKNSFEVNFEVTK